MMDIVAAAWAVNVAIGSGVAGPRYSHFQNRQFCAATCEYMRENKTGNDGAIWGTVWSPSSWGFDWTIQDDGLGYKKIYNRLTGQYLKQDYTTHNITVGDYNAASWAFQWTIH
jgi:hypothetical protein